MRTEDQTISNKRITFFYDDKHEFFGILVDGRHSQELEDKILDKFSPIDVELFDNGELNTKLMDIIINYLAYV